MAPIGKLEGAAAAASGRCASTVVVERCGVATLSFVSRPPPSPASSSDVENDLGRLAKLFRARSNDSRVSRDDEARASVAGRTPFTRVAVIARR